MDSSIQLEGDAQDCVLSLLALRDPNRSVTPETPTGEQESQSEANNGTAKPVAATMKPEQPATLPIEPSLPLIAPRPIPSFTSLADSLHPSILPHYHQLSNALALQQHNLGPIPRGYGWDEGQGLFQEKEPPLLEEYPEIDYDTLLGGSKLVFRQDRGLVPDGLWCALAQMKPCRLKESDRFGPYKNRELGSIGLCCKYCGGSPGFGRFFPATQRSAAQTTTSQTMTKHIDSRCRFVPEHIRYAINELQRIQYEKDCTNAAGRPRYGARKVFFDRVWARLHSEENSPPEEPEDVPFEGRPVGHLSSPRVAATNKKKEDKKQPAQKRKAHRFGMLPTKKNVKRRKMRQDADKRVTR